MFLYDDEIYYTKPMHTNEELFYTDKNRKLLCRYGDGLSKLKVITNQGIACKNAF